MGRTRRRPTDVELQMLQIFWQHGPCTVRQVHNHITQSDERRETSYSTTLKMIQVLHEKGFLTRDESVRPQVYRAEVSRQETQASLLQDLAHRLFGGAMQDLVQCAVNSPEMSDEQRAELESIIQDAKRPRKTS